MNKHVDFDDFTQNYNKLLSESTNFFSSSEEYFARYKVALVQKHAGSSVRRVLEYGCGIGRNVPYLRQAFPNAVIVGSDISRGSLEIAQRDNAGVEFVHEGGSDDKHSLHSFDVIFVAGVFHHVPPVQRLEVARTLLGRLAQKGLLFVFEHNPFNPVTRRIVSNCPYDADAELMKPSQLQKLLRQAGFVIQRKSYCLFVPPKLSVLAPLERRLGWLPLGGQYWIMAQPPL